MSLFKNPILLFLELQKVVNPETWKIFRPIIAEVERQDKEAVLSLPVESTTWVEWLIKPHEGDNFYCPHYLFLMLHRSLHYKVGLRLVARLGSTPDNHYREAYTELFRTGQISNIDFEDEVYYCDVILRDLERFPMQGKINPKVIAKRILTEARRIHREQTEIIRRRKIAAQKERQALVPDTPNPSTN